MHLQERIDLLVRLGEYMKSDDKNLELAKHNAAARNPWFAINFINLAIDNIAQNFLKREVLEEWINSYVIHEKNSTQKVGIVMAGNIPLVGFHDFLCVFVSGHAAKIKPSSKDEVLIRHLVEKMGEWKSDVLNYISFANHLKGCDAYIATGSNNSGRYFEYYFRKYASIIRGNKTSVALLTGEETADELSRLADDMQLYFGLGCRNVTQLYVPEGYNFIQLLEALKKYEYFMDFHKYKHNYDYQLALLIMNNKYYMDNGSLLLTENNLLFSPVARVNYAFYKDKDLITNELIANNNTQTVVGKGHTPFGMAQSPALNDYADGIDTMQFLTSL